MTMAASCLRTSLVPSQLAIHAKKIRWSRSVPPARTPRSAGSFVMHPAEIADCNGRTLALAWEKAERKPSQADCVLCCFQTRETINVELNNRFPLEDVHEAQQFDSEFLTSIFEVAREMEDIERDSTGWKLLRDTTAQGTKSVLT